jgi:hypothetical protein
MTGAVLCEGAAGAACLLASRPHEAAAAAHGLPRERMRYTWPISSLLVFWFGSRVPASFFYF